MKQMLVMRKDLNCRKGKLIAQGAHASTKALIENLSDYDVRMWLASGMSKIAVSVDSLEELEKVVKKASDAGLITAVICDAGKTEFHGVPTITCAAIGPASNEKIDPITGDLKLL